MKILVTSIGTRGDMEPFLAIGEILKARGHEVICQFPEQFRSLAEDSGFAFETLGKEFMEMLESDIGKFAIGGEGTRLQKLMAYVKLARLQQDINKSMVRQQLEAVEKLKPDRIVHNGKVMYPVIWEIDNPGKTVFVSPVPYLHYVKGHTHLGFHSNYGKFLNKMTFRLADWGLLRTIMISVKWLGLNGVTPDRIRQSLRDHKVIYTISPQLFPPPADWPDNLQVLGYYQRHSKTNWEPSLELLSFLQANKNPVFVTFGSMTNPEPERKTSIILNILQRNKIPAIINTAAGGLVEPAEYDRSLIHFVSSIPYDWIFPKVYAVIHHGGSGTTHMTLRNNCASLIIPHIIDQFLWNDLAAENGVGPRGIKISKITEKRLEPLILDLVKSPSYKRNATELGKRMRDENLEDALCRQITG